MTDLEIIPQFVNDSEELFLQYRNDPFYQDKSELLCYTNKILNTSSSCICVTRPRRFGKSLAFEMLNAYYSKGCDSDRLFFNAKISKFDLIKITTPNSLITEIVEHHQTSIRLNQLLDPLKAEFKEKFDQYIRVNIEDYKTHLNKYDVIKITLNDVIDLYQQRSQEIALLDQMKPLTPKERELLLPFVDRLCIKQESIIKYLMRSIINNLREQYPNIIPDTTLYDLKSVLKLLYKECQCKFIILIDEWDVLFRDEPYINDQKLKLEYVDFLRQLFKSNKAVSLAYITGILPILKYNSESSLNNFIEYSMLKPRELAPFFGFTKDETMALCSKANISFEKISKWYDGYLLNGIHIYNPYSVINAITSKQIANYWTQTSASTFAFNFIFGTNKLTLTNNENNVQELQDLLMQLLSGRSIKANLNTFAADPQKITTKDHLYGLLLCLGYLSFNNTAQLNDDLTECSLKIPNYEVQLALKEKLLEHEYDLQNSKIHMLNQRSHDFLEAIINKDQKLVAKLVQEVHNNSVELISFQEYNHESALRFTLQFLLLFSALGHYNFEKEASTGSRYADLILIPLRNDLAHPPIIFEFKLNRSSDVAIKQIIEQNYKQKIRLNSKEPIYYVGINYDKDTKEHECTITIDLD